MLDPNFDPYQDLIDLHIEVEMLKTNQQTLLQGHNRMNHLVMNQQKELLKQLKYIQQQQVLIAELSHELAVLKDKALNKNSSC
jgi:hypothetical protein